MCKNLLKSHQHLLIMINSKNGTTLRIWNELLDRVTIDKRRVFRLGMPLCRWCVRIHWRRVPIYWRHVTLRWRCVLLSVSLRQLLDHFKLLPLVWRAFARPGAALDEVLDRRVRESEEFRSLVLDGWRLGTSEDTNNKAIGDDRRSLAIMHRWRHNACFHNNARLT